MSGSASTTPTVQLRGPMLAPTTAACVIDGLRTADDQLRADALLHARRWFHDSADRALQRIRTIPEGASTTTEDLALVAELLGAALRRADE